MLKLNDSSYVLFQYNKNLLIANITSPFSVTMNAEQFRSKVDSSIFNLVRLFKVFFTILEPSIEYTPKSVKAKIRKIMNWNNFCKNKFQK